MQTASAGSMKSEFTEPYVVLSKTIHTAFRMSVLLGKAKKPVCETHNLRRKTIALGASDLLYLIFAETVVKSQ